MLIKPKLKNQLIELGVKPGDLLMVHASMRAVGPILGGPDELLHAITEILTPQGTLMMYVGCSPEFEALGRNGITLDKEQELYEYCPTFDANNARARRDYGMLAEFFRNFPGVQCSSNPGARMAAYGRQAKWLVDAHPLQYGYGVGSPLDKLYHGDGKVMLLGSDLDQVTLLHYAEHQAPIAEKRVVHFKVPLMQKDKRVWVDVEEFDTSMAFVNGLIVFLQ